jgi:hypothetical protein
MGSVYIITSPSTPYFYIGRTKLSLELRLSNHISTAKHKKYGASRVVLFHDVCIKQLIYTDNWKELLILERDMIANVWGDPNLANISVYNSSPKMWSKKNDFRLLIDTSRKHT